LARYAGRWGFGLGVRLLRDCATVRAVGGDLALFATPRARQLVLLATALLVLVRLGATDLWPPDEPRYALVAEELRSLEHGASGFVLLHLHGHAYTQKPPLFYWLAAAAGAPLGRVTEFAARLPSAVAGIATVAATIALGALLLGRGAGTLAGLLLATTFDWGFRARTVQLDTLLALFETTALLAFWRLRAGAGERRRNLVWLHVSLGLAVLTKGPVGFLVPLLAIAAYLAWERRLREVRSLLPAWGFALSLGPALLWFSAAVALAPRGFFQDAFVDNLFGRALEGTAHAQPFYYYLEKFPPDLLPWLSLLPATLWAARRSLAADAAPGERSAWRFLFAWIATSVLFFSLASGKRLRYLLPMEPACALLFAATLRSWLANAARAPRHLAIAAGVLGTAAVAAAAIAFGRADAIAAKIQFGDGGMVRALAVALAATAAIGAIGWVWLARRGSAVESRIALLAAGVFAVQLLSYAVLLPALDPENSPRPIAEAAIAVAHPGESIGLYRGADISDATAYYGRRPVAAFRTPERLAEYMAGGGRILICEEERLAEVESVAPMSVRGRFRVRGDSWLLLVRTPPES
jgi:4-amino-4-deoxy-L-arabinose transferase-like glycosyltransferase